LTTGTNAVGVWLGGGWYDMPTKDEWGWHKARWRGAPRLLLRLVMELEDGKRVDLVSDPDWKVTDQGPIVFNSVRSGETYDARRELRGWAAAGFNASAWKDVDILKAPGGRVVRQNLPPIKVVETMPVREITEPKPGVHVFHFGQNFSGWVRLKVSGPAGTRVRLRYGERLGKEGALDVKGIARYTYGRFQTDEYVLKGDGVEEWSPRFCYHAFRYVEVTGLPGAPTKDTLEGRAVHSAVEPAGTFSCSSDVINQVQSACVWTLRSNIHSIPQDCPHREKLGWMADGLAAARQGVYNYDMERFYAKWIADMRAAQNLKTGFVSPIVPDVGWSYPYFDPCWSGASVILPWRMYLHYGDRRFLSDNVAMMKAYTDSLTAKAKDHLLSQGKWNDWMGPGVPAGMTATAYYYQCARIVSQTSVILGDTVDSERYGALADQIKEAFLAQFHDAATSRFKAELQTVYGLALALGLAPDGQREAVGKRFAELVATRDRSHIQAGIVGTPYVLEALTDVGRADLAYAMAAQTNRPGWFAMTVGGKNSIDENWQGNDSLNHPAFSCVSAWFYEGLAGIRPDPAGPGFSRFIIEPHVVGDLTHASASYRSPYGVIRSAWTRDRDRVKFMIQVPANTTATVVLPDDNPGKVTVDGRSLSEAKDLRVTEGKPGSVQVEIGSGQYEFATTR
jgi:alpha-L-rhamnosidase